MKKFFSLISFFKNWDNKQKFVPYINLSKHNKSSSTFGSWYFSVYARHFTNLNFPISFFFSQNRYYSSTNILNWELLSRSSFIFTLNQHFIIFTKFLKHKLAKRQCFSHKRISTSTVCVIQFNSVHFSSAQFNSFQLNSVQFIPIQFNLNLLPWCYHKIFLPDYIYRPSSRYGEIQFLQASILNSKTNSGM